MLFLGTCEVSQTYKYVQASSDPWYCLSCSNTILAFSNFDGGFSYLMNGRNKAGITNKNDFVSYRAILFSYLINLITLLPKKKMN